ncbi:MAG: hypothetical protein JWO34_2352 [Arthrobacter sp.]|nr:hypothetical protein [Arthrobacter sp.]
MEGPAPPTDFQHELELIRGKSRPHTPKRWSPCWQAAPKSSVSTRAWSPRAWWNKTPGPAKTEAKAPDARTTALIALLQAAGLLGKLFPSADRVRASELAKDYWPSRAVEDELRLIRLAEEEAATL